MKYTAFDDKGMKKFANDKRMELEKQHYAATLDLKIAESLKNDSKIMEALDRIAALEVSINAL